MSPAGAEREVEPGEALRRRIEERAARLAVVGLGYAGLPLAVAFARAGFQVDGIDLDRARIEALGRGESYIPDVAGAVVGELVRAGRLRASAEYGPAAAADCVLICVPTPLGKSREPDLCYVHAALEALGPHLRPGQLLVLESTVYPGTTQELVVPALERQGLRVGRDAFVAFSPERIDPGNRTWRIENTPKLIGGVSAACTRVAAALYRAAIATVIEVSSAAVAEMAKLWENTYRAVNIGFANEMALLCHRLGLDVWEVIEAAASKPFGFQPFWPGPGLGGHCLPVDPLYLSWKARTVRAQARFIELADEINRAMPLHCLQRIADLLNQDGKPVRNSRVLLLGMAYKKNVGDTRESPAVDLAALLLERGAEVRYADPYVPSCRIGEVELHAVALSADELRQADLVAVLADHDAFEVELILQHARRIFDARNLTRGRGGPRVSRL
ncbi:MAG: UDP-N-acetyl-D-glucosamine dehydrogenase [Planctomycetota bacterium]|nr:MAG: UDP-N-acetyl-D-glucosamine dehydrogenase [Planctomycetota bacterium]